MKFEDRADALVLQPPGSGGMARASGRRSRLLLLLLVAALAAAVITLVMRETDQPSALHTTHPPTATHLPPSPPQTSSTPGSVVASALPVTVTEVGHRLLGISTGWELLARGSQSTVRIQLARGQITRTTLPGLASSGAVSFVAAADRVIIRPWDYVAGYVVPDGKPSRELPAAFGQGGPTLPGPDPRHLWVQSGDNQHAVMVLVALDGTPAGLSIPIPAGMDPFVQADGGGYLLISGTGGGGMTPARTGCTESPKVRSSPSAPRVGWLAIATTSTTAPSCLSIAPAGPAECSAPSPATGARPAA